MATGPMTTRGGWEDVPVPDRACDALTEHAGERFAADLDMGPVVQAVGAAVAAEVLRSFADDLDALAATSRGEDGPDKTLGYVRGLDAAAARARARATVLDSVQPGAAR